MSSASSASSFSSGMKIFCSGIGGIGLSAYASLQRAAGNDVSGSDRTESDLLEDLRSQGIAVLMNQDGSGVPKDADLFVYSEASPEQAPERIKAAEYGIPQKSYPQALAELTQGKRVIAVCGTHGKSSTTAMAARLLMQSGLDPSIVIGTKMKELDGSNWHRGSGEIFLIEACEYRRSFLHYAPEIILLSTCDGDHFDYFKDQNDYDNAFVEFLERLPEDGSVITHLDDPDCARVVKRSQKKVIDADRYPMISLQTPGRHMQQNAQLALALGDLLQIPPTSSEQSLSGYAGAWRRMEKRGLMHHDVPVYDDYGHHPREIRATLQGLRAEYSDRRLICVFQPHTHDRTLKLYDAFAESFADADLVIIPNIYDARAHLEKESVDVDRFVQDIAERSKVEARNGTSLAETEKMLLSTVQSNDLVVCMGAGDVTDLATRLIL